MPKWTKKAALERMRANQELQQVYERYPLARILVESASRLKRYSGYNRISCHYAYKDWKWAATTTENKAYWMCIHVIDDLIPPDASDLELEGVVSIYTHNPTLPGLPLLPKKEGQSMVISKNGKSIFRILSMSDLENDGDEEEQRHIAMHKTLEEIASRLIHPCKG